MPPRDAIHRDATHNFANQISEDLQFDRQRLIRRLVILRSSSLSSTVVNRTALARLWRWMKQLFFREQLVGMQPASLRCNNRSHCCAGSSAPVTPPRPRILLLQGLRSERRLSSRSMTSSSSCRRIAARNKIAVARASKGRLGGERARQRSIKTLHVRQAPCIAAVINPRATLTGRKQQAAHRIPPPSAHRAWRQDRADRRAPKQAAPKTVPYPAFVANTRADFAAQ